MRKTKQPSWNETSINEAISAHKTNKMGLKKAATTFDVQKESFRRRLQKLEKNNTGDNTDIIHNYSVDLQMCCLKVNKKS